MDGKMKKNLKKYKINESYFEMNRSRFEAFGS